MMAGNQLLLFKILVLLSYPTNRGTALFTSLIFINLFSGGISKF
jgi:hypothetical protein